MPKVTKAGLRPYIDVARETVYVRVMDGGKLLASCPFDLDAIPAAIRTRLTLHGLSTLLQQRTSDVKGDPLAKLDAMQPVYERLCEGEWKAEKQSGTRTVAPIIEVLAAKKGVSIAATQKAYAALPGETKEAILRKFADEVMAVVAKRSEAEDVDLSGLVD